MSYLTYKQLNLLDEFSFVAGTPFTLTYTVYDEDGATPLDLASSTTKLYVSPYGQLNYVAIEVAGVVSVTPGVFTVTLTTAHTSALSGLFVQQPAVIDFTGEEFRLGQGNFIIEQRIG